MTVTQTGGLSKGVATAGRVLGGPEAGALISAAGGAYSDAQAGKVREGRELWVATSLDAGVGAGVSYVADGLGIVTGVAVTGLAVETGPAAPFIGVAAGTAVAGGTAYGLGAGWGAVRNDVIDFTVNTINTVESTYNRLSDTVNNFRKDYCLYNCK